MNYMSSLFLDLTCLVKTIYAKFAKQTSSLLLGRDKASIKSEMKVSIKNCIVHDTCILFLCARNHFVIKRK